MKKNLLLLGVVAICAASCKKGDLPNESVGTFGAFSKKTFAAGDGKNDVLGYGLDVTGNLQDINSQSNVPIIDMVRFENDYPNGINVNTTIAGSDISYTGATVQEYLKDMSDNIGYGISGSQGASTGTQANPNPLYFTGSVSKNTSDETKNGYSSRYSYATYESIERVKRLQFNSNISQSLLMSYLTLQFQNDIATMSPDDLIAKYRTHILLGIDMGGILKFDYSGNDYSTTDYTKRTADIKVGLGVSIFSIIGVNLNYNRSSSEITQITNSTVDREYKLSFYGGSNSGRTISIDKDGNTSQTINLGAWQQTITPNNAALIGVVNAAYIYDFIADPVKKAAVKAAVETYINNKQIALAPVPVYGYWSLKGADHYYTTVKKDYGDWAYERIAFNAYPTQVSGTVPVYEYWNSVGVDHYYTTENKDYGSWTYSKIAFFAYPSQIAGTVPVFEFWSLKAADHYYTTVYKDYGDWKYSMIGFYAFPN